MASNGHLTNAELAPAAGGVPGSDPGQGQLATKAAAAWNAMAVKIYEETGEKITCNGPDSLYRPYDRQVYWRNYWCAQGACGNAASPGTSNHGWGLAGDLPPRTIQLIAQYGAQFGWRKECSDAPWEGWHFKWCGGWDGKDPGPDYEDGPQYPNLESGDEGAAVKRLQTRLKLHNRGITRPDVTGDFDKTTEKAVREFQLLHNLNPDGFVGEKTWNKLRQPDPLMDSERSNVNRLKVMESGVEDKDEEKMDAHRIWLAKRALWMESHGDAWWNNKRRVRHTIVKREAGNQYEQVKNG